MSDVPTYHWPSDPEGLKALFDWLAQSYAGLAVANAARLSMRLFELCGDVPAEVTPTADGRELHVAFEQDGQRRVVKLDSGPFLRP